MPKVSVIIPVYGVEKYIARCAHSLFGQTLDDIEFLFINDCTKDNSIVILEDVLKEYPNRIPQTRIVSMLSNSGQAAVREHGHKLAIGEYIIHCDSDDWLDHDAYRLLYNEAVSSNLDIVWCDYYRSDGVNHKIISQKRQPELMQGPVWNKLVKRSLYTDHNIIFPKRNKAEDGALMTQISFYASSRRHIEKPLYYYYNNPESICGQVSESACKDKLEQEIENTKLRISFLEREGVLDKYKHEVMLWKLEARRNLIPVLSKKGNLKLWRHTFSEVNKEYLLSGKISIKKKLKFLATYLGIYR